MAVNLSDIELGAGELIVFHYADNTPLYWDLNFEWDSGQTWLTEHEIGGSSGPAGVEAEFGGNFEYKDIRIVRAVCDVKSSRIGYDGTLKVRMLDSAMQTLVTSFGGDVDDITTDATSEKYVFGGDAKHIVLGLRYRVDQIDDANKHDELRIWRAHVKEMSPVILKKEEERAWDVTFAVEGEQLKSWLPGEFVRDK